MLHIENISVQLHSFALNTINLDIQSGEYHVLAGPSGSGKTLLLNTISGFYKSNSGKIFLNNTDITHIPPNKRHIAYLFQDLALFPHMTVTENIAFPLQMSKVSKQNRTQRINELLDFFNITKIKDRYPSYLSGGEKQRVALARCLSTNQKLLLLDEPFSAIDAQLWQSFIALLKKISDTGITILHVTHNYKEAHALAHKLSIIVDGKIAETGLFEDIIKNSNNDFVNAFAGKSQQEYINRI